ncbi:MAG: sulfotransferase family protein [Sarcina sp.]
MKRNIVTCASYGGTGSSVITDLLKEFSNVKSTGDFEVTIAHEYGGISDLEHYLVNDFHRLKNDAAVYDFKNLVKRIDKEYNKFFDDRFTSITENYINALIEAEWSGYWHQHEERYFGLEKVLKYKFPYLRERIKNKFRKKKHDYEFVPKQRRTPMYLGTQKEIFFIQTKEYFNNLFEILDSQEEFDYIATDQLVPPTNISRYLNYFDNLKVIVVDRDPRDLYILNKLYWKEGWIPTDDIEIFIRWFKSIRINKMEESNESVLRVKFEDFIINYEETLDKILIFLNIDSSNHKDKFLHFDPKKSIKNFKLYERKEIMTKDLLEDVRKLEVCLKEFI